MREAVVLASLEHPGIVPVHDAGTLADGRTFYCMKFVEGQTLDQHIVRRSLRERLHLLQRIAEPLAFAHARGIVHRDLKPGNIMVGPFGEVLIMDWGLAKSIGPSSREPALAPLSRTETQAGPAPASQATGHGSVLGTPGYMAPEQARGDVDQIDKRTDVYALGAVLSFVLRDPKPQKTSRPKPLIAICRKAMAPDMAERYESVGDLAADVGRYLEGEPVSVYRESMLERGIRFCARHQAAIVLIVAYLLMRLLFILFSRR
jgi:serine/threonine-protein kinase